MVDDVAYQNRLASFLTAKNLDPASAWPGAPPMMGVDFLPHIFTVAGTQGAIGRAYMNPDEAVMHDPSNSERMRNDALIAECMRARQLATANLKWHITPEQGKNSEAKEMAQAMTKVIERTPRFTEFKRALLEAVWCGRYAVANQFVSRELDGKRRIVCGRWEPRHGDKLIFPYNDGTHDFDPDRIGIRIGTTGAGSRAINQSQTQYTQFGQTYWLNKAERKTVVVHKHQVEDGPFEDVRVSGRIHGVGVRSQIYWTWYAMNDAMRRALEYLDRAAFGVELWRFPANNPRAKEETRKAAERHVGGGRTVVLVPVMPGEQSDLYGVDHIEPGLAGIDALLRVIKDFYEEKIKRLIIGQTLTSEAHSTGLGSGVANAHLATFHDIISYDARNLEETLAKDYLRPLQLWNFPGYDHIHLQFSIDTESDNVQERLAAYRQAWDMGMGIKTDDIAAAIGVSVPQPDEDFVCNPQLYAAIKQFSNGGLSIMGPANQQPGAQALAMAQIFQQAITNALGVAA
jgi:hypothetical protein